MAQTYEVILCPLLLSFTDFFFNCHLESYVTFQFKVFYLMIKPLDANLGRMSKQEKF